MTRIISGVILAILCVVMIFFFSPMCFVFGVMVMILICLVEYFGMLRKGGIEALTYSGTLLGLMLGWLTYGENQGHSLALYSVGAPFFTVTLITFMAVFFLATIRGDRLFERAAYTLFGIFYIPLTLITLPFIRESSGGVMLLFTLVAANAIGDVCAYYTGRRFGKHKLAPVISPNKTVEGFFGGAVGALALSLAVGLGTDTFLPWWDFVALGLIAGICGPMGDLTESGIKRAVGVKDSSSLIPGHGGLLDRIDSLMFSAPVFYLYLTQVA